ncbi:MAG: c-type cytochrome [Pikeienuella sp.]
MELNKIVGAFCSTLLVFLGLNFFAELVFAPAHEEGELAFALAVEESGGGEAEVVDIGTYFAEADIAKGEKVFKKCAACHKAEDGANGTGPFLYGVVDRAVDTAAGYSAYSGALAAVGDKWSPEALFHFLENPRKVAPGTKMGFAGIKSPQDRADLIAYLNETDGTPDPLPQPGAAPAEGGEEPAANEEAPAEGGEEGATPQE